MAWQITRNGVDHTVDVEALGDDRFVVTVDGERHELEAGAPEAGVLAILRGTRRQEADVVVDGSAVSVTVDGRRHDLTVVDERQLALRALGLGGGGGADNVVSTSMPGKVVTLLVQEGDRVEVGQGVIVVEAMKMENELKAAAAGVIASIAVSVGEAVEGGAPLVIIEPDDG
jgi:biotin carboxyl carrier protein